MSELIYGPNTDQVTAFIERCKVLTGEEIEKIADWYASRDASWANAREAARNATSAAAIKSIRSSAGYTAGYAAGDAARVAALNGCYAAWVQSLDTAWAIVVMDLITAEYFALLTAPFAEILVELGIVWKASESVKTEFTK